MATVSFNGNGLAEMKITHETCYLSDGTSFKVRRVYVIPHQGVLIDHILCRESWKDNKGKWHHLDKITQGWYVTPTYSSADTFHDEY